MLKTNKAAAGGGDYDDDDNNISDFKMHQILSSIEGALMIINPYFCPCCSNLQNTEETSTCDNNKCQSVIC